MMEPTSFQCPKCGAISHNPHDIEQRYCARCHVFVDDEPEIEPIDVDNCAHEWAYTGTIYGGDDDRWHGEGRCFCIWCGADGDA
jgi:hypothetical protein